MIIPIIAVCEPEGPFGAWSNFAVLPFFCDGEGYLSIEHYFQASKFLCQNDAEEVRGCATPQAAKTLAWRWDDRKRKDWEATRFEIMRRALLEKFLQWPEPRAQIVSSYPFPIVETNLKDRVWGIGDDHSGANLWGRCAMEVRSELLQLPCDKTNVWISDRAKFTDTSDWRFLDSEEWNIPRALVEDESLEAGEISVLGTDIVELVEKKLRHSLPDLELPRWSSNTKYAYKRAILSVGEDHYSVANGDFDAARALAYETKYAEFSAGSDARSCVPNWHEHCLELLSSKVNWNNAYPLLVIGSGVGEEAARLWRRFGSGVVLSEISPVLARSCIDAAPAATVRIGVAEDLSDLAANSIGSYFALRTLESMFLDKTAALEEAFRVLKPGGTIGVSVSCGYNVDGKLLKGRFVGEGKRDVAGGAKDALELIELMRKSGFTLEHLLDLKTEWLMIAYKPTMEL